MSLDKLSSRHAEQRKEVTEVQSIQSEITRKVLAEHRGKSPEYSILNGLRAAVKERSNGNFQSIADGAVRELVGTLATSTEQRLALDLPVDTAIMLAYGEYGIRNQVDMQDLTAAIKNELDRRQKQATKEFRARAEDAMMPGIARNTPVSSKDAFDAWQIGHHARKDDTLQDH